VSEAHNDEKLIQEVTSRFVVDAFRKELREGFGVASKHFFLGVVFIILLCVAFGSYVILSGMNALRENTQTLRELRDYSQVNRTVLQTVQKDIELRSAQFEVIRKQFEMIDTRLQILRKGKSK